MKLTTYMIMNGVVAVIIFIIVSIAVVLFCIEVGKVLINWWFKR